MRARSMVTRLLTHLTPARNAVGRLIADNVAELMVAGALLLIAVGLRAVWPPGSFIVPGAVVLWIYLPPRTAFVVSGSGDKKGRT